MTESKLAEHLRHASDINYCFDHPESIFEYRRFDIKWSGWRIAVNAFARFGFWTAHLPSSGQVHYSTVWGTVGTSWDGGVADMTLTDDVRRRYPNILMLTATDERRLAIEAAQRLLQYVDHTAP